MKGENNMYIVIRKSSAGYHVCKFKHLDEAQSLVKKLAQEGDIDVTLSREIPFKLNIDVEFYEEI